MIQRSAALSEIGLRWLARENSEKRGLAGGIVVAPSGRSMKIQKVLRRVLLGALVLAFGAIIASADIYSTPLRGGEVCARCDRVVENPVVAAEILSTHKSIAAPFRTISCMLTFLRDKEIAADRIFVADRTTGRLTPVEQAYFVRVPIAELSENASYGIGEFDYVAFRSAVAAARMADRYGSTPLGWSELPVNQ
jgi:hypothetical protein